MPQPESLGGEFAFIEWIRSQLAHDARVPIGIGDDTAAVRIAPGRELLVTTDMILEGVHFDLASTSPREVGRKAMGVNLSDIAAMAGVPLAAVIAVGLPPSLTRQAAEELFHGIRELADEFQVAIVGGDTNRSGSGLIVSITVLGETTPRGAVRRGGARDGDWICVTGALGGSLSGKHLAFVPRVREALVLHEQFRLRAMIDVSDGLAADLGHILEESGCGAVIRSSAIPVSDAARAAGGGRTPLEHALHDGEDFELLFTLAEAEARRLITEQPLEVPVTHIGEITASADLQLEDADGARCKIEPRGYDHFQS